MEGWEKGTNVGGLLRADDGGVYWCVYHVGDTCFRSVKIFSAT